MAIATIITAISTAVAAVSTALGTTAFTIGTFAVTWGAIAQTIIFGGVALSSSIQANQKPHFDTSSPTYRSGVLQTQTDQNLPIPLLYGTCKLAGNRIWQDTNSQNPIKRIVAFAEGEISDFTDIRLNDIPINEITGIKINKYYGTDEQIVDSIVDGSSLQERIETVGSLKNIAYLAITVPRTSKIDLNYNLTAVVKGRKIRVYKNKNNYSIQYSENPSWVLFDFLTSYNGLGLGIDKTGKINEYLIQQLFDLDSFIEAAEYCDELIEYNNGQSIETVPRFTFNMIFDAQTSARDLIDEIFRSCRGGLFVKDGKLQFKIDKKEPVSKVFTENDIIKGSECFQTIPKDEQYDILKCSFISPNHAWQKVEATAELAEYNADIPIEHSVNVLSVTNFQQASRLAWYYINSKKLQPYFGSFQTDYRAYDIEVGDVICVDSILMGLKKYKIKVTKIEDSGTGIFTVHWRNYDERLYNDDLGSKEPKVLVSNLSDILKYPDDVKNFNVIQSNNLFNFIWEENKDSSNTYEIRVGESWQNSTIVKSNISENHFSTNIKSTGLQKFWIKAFNSYNYSQNATLDVINVDSIPQLNEIVKIDILENINGTLSDTLKIYQNTIKLKETNTFWKTNEICWSNNSQYYQNGGIWGSEVNNFGVYTSEVFDVGACLNSVITFDLQYTSPDEQNNILIEWSFSDDGINFCDWIIANNGSYKFRFCKFKITFNAPNNIQTVLTKFLVNIDVPDKNIDMDAEIIDTNGLKIEYDFINPPSIVATVNDSHNAYIVITEKTNKYAILKAYTNTGDLTTCKLSLSAKGY